MRRDELFLRDIVEAAEAIQRFIRDRAQEEFIGDDLLSSAVLHKLTLIGEAAHRLSPELLSRYPEADWKAIVGLRNIVVHAYFSVDWSIVWTTATQDVPLLKATVQEILAKEFGD